MKEYPLVEKFMPKNISRYFEPFVGGASIYLNINICNSYINDKSEDLANIYRFVKEQNRMFFSHLIEFDRLWKEIEQETFNLSELFDTNIYLQYFNQSLRLKKRKIVSLEEDGYKISDTDKNDIVLTAKKTAFYMCVRDLYNNIDNDLYLHTACFYFIREYCYSSMFRFSKDGKFNVPYGGRSYNLKYMTFKIEQMQSIETINYFKNTSIYQLDFETFLNAFALSENDFIFLDPPYDSEFSTYDNNAFDKNEQVRLCEFLQKTKAKWMLIIKKTEFISTLYKNFYIYEYEKNYLVSFKNRNAKDVKHLLITNYRIEE